MSNLTTALTFVMVLNALMFLTQAAVIGINPSANSFYTNNGTMLSNFDANNNNGEPVLDSNGLSSALPSGQSSVSPTTGNLFTDTFSSIKGWLSTKTGLAYIFGILTAPYNLLKSLNVPNAFAFAIGSLWYGITFFLIIAFIWGRDS